LSQGLKGKAYDMALVHPAHHSIRAIKDSGYQLLAVAKGYENYRASFLVRADSPLKSLAELKGQRLGAPDEDSITAWMVRATLRDAIGDARTVKVTYTRYQDAVPFFLENKLTHAGATAAGSVIKDWQARAARSSRRASRCPSSTSSPRPRSAPSSAPRCAATSSNWTTPKTAARSWKPPS
jgi:phosphonate transport system substrate-binding protein